MGRLWACEGLAPCFLDEIRRTDRPNWPKHLCANLVSIQQTLFARPRLGVLGARPKAPQLLGFYMRRADFDEHDPNTSRLSFQFNIIQLIFPDKQVIFIDFVAPMVSFW